MEFKHILYEVKDNVARITLNRPERLNAFTGLMPLEIASAVETACADDDVRAIAITGAGRGFCAGADLSSAGPKPGDPEFDAGKALEIAYNPMIQTMRSSGGMGAATGVIASSPGNWKVKPGGTSTLQSATDGLYVQSASPVSISSA